MKKRMEISKYVKPVLIVLTALLVVSCSKDDDTNTGGSESNEIKRLTASPQTIVNSTYLFGSESEKKIHSIDIGEDEGVNFYILKNDEVEIQLSQDDNNFPDGKQVFLVISNQNVYSGINLTVSSMGENAFIIKGQITNTADAKDIRDITITVQASQVGAGDSKYTIKEDKAYISGNLGTYTFNQILEINKDHPDVKTLVLTDIPGSVNDEVNVQTGRLIREAGYSTHLLANSDINSGGVDLFCSGVKRTREAGSKIGVHSWCCHEGLTADKLPKDSPAHNSQLTYFREMLGEINGPEFYFFTLQAAPFNGIHVMTDAEIAKYKLITN